MKKPAAIMTRTGSRRIGMEGIIDYKPLVSSVPALLRL
jgi:hypothetical protein